MRAGRKHEVKSGRLLPALFLVGCGHAHPVPEVPLWSDEPHPHEAVPAADVKADRGELAQRFGRLVRNAMVASRKSPPPRRIGGAKRGTVTDAVSIDYESLPVLGDVPLNPKAAGASFEITSKVVNARCDGANELIVRWSMQGLRDVPWMVHLGADKLTPFDSKTGLFMRGFGADPADFFASEAVGDAEWTGVDMSRRTDDAIRVISYDGTFDAGRMKGEAREAFTVDAPAIVPGVVYAFRRCTAWCGEPLGSPARIEEIELIGPASTWIASAGARDESELESGQLFTDARTVVKPGSSSSISFTVHRSDLDAFKSGIIRSAAQRADTWRDERDNKAESYLTVSFEVVWPADDLPQASFFTSGFYGRPNPRPPFYSGECY